MFVDRPVLKPISFQIELVAGCNKTCKFCAMPRLRKSAYPWNEHAYVYMDMALLKKLVSDIAALNERPRVEFSLRGEAILHPGILECIRVVRRALPRSQIMIFTNGLFFRKGGCDIISDMFGSGLNIILIDCYEPYGESLIELVTRYSNGIDNIHLHRYGTDRFSPWTYNGCSDADIVFVPDVLVTEKNRVITRRLHNFAGAAYSIDRPLKRMCHIPWRWCATMYNGNVVLCCTDFGEEYVIGNVTERSLSDIWADDGFIAARRLLRYGNRIFSPCSRCDDRCATSQPLPHCDRNLTDAERSRMLDIMGNSPSLYGFDAEWWEEI